LYLELLDEEIYDVHLMGINGYAYINDSYLGMIDNRVLPWTQDIPEVNVWGTWNATIRDIVIVDRHGNEFTRINLTTYNPDPEKTCGENYQVLKDLLLAARDR